MRQFFPFVFLLTACAQATAQESPDNKIAERDLREFKLLLPGTYTNEEQFYFQRNLGMPESSLLPRMTLTVEPDGNDFISRTENVNTGDKTQVRLTYRVEDGRIRSREIRKGEPDCERVFTRAFESFLGEGCDGHVRVTREGLSFGPLDNPFKMHRAVGFKCWVSPQKENGEYGFQSDLSIHNQGGRIWVEAAGEGEEAHPRVGLKLRHVEWPIGRNRDSLVLYAYRGDEEDKAVSYVWAAPDTSRIALNLRWMQASCERGDIVHKPGINLKTGSGT